MNLMQFEEYVRELRRLGFKRKRIYRMYLSNESMWSVTRKQAVKIINAC